MPALLLDVAVRATLVAAGTACILRALRVKTAAERHAAWTAVLICMLLLPIYSLTGPKLPLAVLPGHGPSPQADAGARPEETSVGSGLALTQFALTRETAPVNSSRSRSISVVIAVYCLGACALLLRLAVGTVHARRLRRSAVMRAGRATSLRCASPITVGWWSPVVILPEGWERWSAGHLDAVLIHEQEHVRRRDPLIQWLALLNRAILWFHPLAWWLARRLSTLAEEACDAAVLRAGHSPQDYADYLIHMAHALSRQGRRLNVTGMAMPGGGLSGRIRHILEEGSMTPRSRTRVFGTLAIGATTSIICAAATLAPRPSAGAVSHAAEGVAVSSVPAEAQTSARIFVIMVDDLRFKPSETRNAELLLALIRDEILTGTDLVGIVSTGPSGVAIDLHSAADPARLNDSILRISNGRPLPVVEAAPGSTAQSADSRYYAHVTFSTATDIVRNLAKLGGGSKHFLFVSSTETAATALEAAVADQGGELARDVAELASAAKLGNVTIRVVNAGDRASANVLRPLK